MKAGLRESMRGEWSGDCDLGDGQLQQMKQVYDDRLSSVRGTCIYNLVQICLYVENGRDVFLHGENKSSLFGSENFSTPVLFLLLDGAVRESA